MERPFVLSMMDPDADNDVSTSATDTQSAKRLSTHRTRHGEREKTRRQIKQLMGRKIQALVR